MADPDHAARSASRLALNRQRVLGGAIAYADASGIDSLSMRSLAHELGVVPMALYKHVSNKDDLLDGMLATLIGEIDVTSATGRWKPDVRRRVLAARRAMLHHPWSRAVLESRAIMTPAMLDYLDSLVGLFLDGGLSADLTHHAMHALGNRMWGFDQELFAATPASDTESFEAQRSALPNRHPHLAEIARAAMHADTGAARDGGCDDQFEFELALDMLLDGVEALHAAGWSSPVRAHGDG